MCNHGTNVIIVIMCDYKIRVMLSSRMSVWLSVSFSIVIKGVKVLKETHE